MCACVYACVCVCVCVFSCRPLLIATYNPEEGPLREHLLDRIAITLSADVPNMMEDRVKAIDAAMKFQDNAAGTLKDTEELTDALRTSVSAGLTHTHTHTHASMQPCHMSCAGKR